MGVKNLQVLLPEEAHTTLFALASNWEDVVHSKEFQVTRLEGALTNEVYQINWPLKGKGAPRKALLRIYGEGVEVFFDRDDEIRTFECLSKLGQGPQLLGKLKNGRVEEFIHSRTLSASDLRDPEVSASIAAKLRKFHTLDMPGPKDVVLWKRLRNWVAKAKDLCETEEAEEFKLDSIKKEIDALDIKFSAENPIVCFCHNDLQYGNIMIDEQTREVTLIDYEYASYNPVAFDLANHFCEMAADYHSITPHVLDYVKYPELAERQEFVRAYLTASGDEPSNDQVEKLVQDVENYAIASHLLWGLWGLISAKVNNKIEFDYMEYARQRFDQYQLTKAKVLEPIMTAVAVE